MIIQHLKLYFKQNTFIAILIIITQIVSTMVILLCYGIYYNNQYKLKEGESGERSISIKFYTDPEDEPIGNYGKPLRYKLTYLQTSMKALKNKFNYIVHPVEENINYVYLYSCGIWDEEPIKFFDNSTEQVFITTAFDYYDGVIKDSHYLDMGNFRDLYEGEWFNPKDLAKGSNKCYVSQDVYEKINKNTVAISDVEYKIIGYMKNDPSGNTICDEMNIPFYSLSDYMYPISMNIEFNRPLYREEYDLLVSNIHEYLGQDVIVSDFFVVDVDEKSVLKTLMVMSVTLGIISAITIGIIYRYLLIVRSKTTAVYKICGGSFIKTSIIYLGEMAVNLTVSMGIGCLLYEWVLHKFLYKQYNWFYMIYSTNKSYLLILAYYFIVLAVTSVFILFNLRKTPTQLLKSTNK